MKFQTHKDCIKHLENIRWNNEPTCPYCKSKKQTPIKRENRYHCNNCNTSYSVLVGTIFENTKLDLQKWFAAISIIINAEKGVSSRKLAKDIEVTKDTAWYMQIRIKKAFSESGVLLKGLIKANELYIDDVNKNRQIKRKTKDVQVHDSGNDSPEIGLIQRVKN